MSPTEKIAFKNKMKKWGLDLIAQRISTVQTFMSQAQEAANSEDKSSAGDKYETGRAMGHLQKEMYGRQLAEWQKERTSLESLSMESTCKEGRAGALLRCDDIDLFISAGLGKQIFDNRIILFLSPQAPLAKSLMGKKPGDLIGFNKTTRVILEIF